MTDRQNAAAMLTLEIQAAEEARARGGNFARAFAPFVKDYAVRCRRQLGMSAERAEAYVASRLSALARIWRRGATQSSDVDELLKALREALPQAPVAATTAPQPKAEAAPAAEPQRYVEQVVVAWSPRGEPARIIERPLAKDAAERAIANAEPPPSGVTRSTVKRDTKGEIEEIRQEPVP